MSNTLGTLFIVATPIGNLADISQRAQETLADVDLIAAEDTRHTQGLLRHLNLQKKLWAYHDHNEATQSDALLARLQQGASIALVSDAGTPLISDPGYQIVHKARALDIPVVPVPGPSAVITALSVSGLPTDRFRFEGFLPAKTLAREKALQQLAKESATLVFYESSHRIVASVQAMAEVFGVERPACIARELTKRFEQIRSDSLQALVEWLMVEENHQKGEFVVMVGGWRADEVQNAYDISQEQLLTALSELPVKQAAQIAAQLTGENKKGFYQKFLQRRES